MAKVKFSDVPSRTAEAKPTETAQQPYAPGEQTTPQKQPEPEPEQEAKKDTQSAPANVAGQPTSAVQTTSPRPFDDENIDPSDIVLGYLSIAQKVGDLGESFDPGSVVYNRTLELTPRPEPNAAGISTRFVCIGFQPNKFVEKVPFGTQGGKTFTSEVDVVKFGGTLSYDEAAATKRPLFERLAVALLLIEQREGLHDDNFPHLIDGKRYLLALYSMRSSSYTHAAKVLKTARKIGHLKEAPGYRGGFWTLQSFLKKYQTGNSSYIPVLKPAGVTSPKLRGYVTSLLGH